MWAQMGIVAKMVVVILGIMSVVTVAITVERLLTFAKAKRQSQAFVKAIQDLLAQGKYAEARAAATSYEGSHISPVIGSALQEFLHVRASGAGREYNVREA